MKPTVLLSAYVAAVMVVAAACGSTVIASVSSSSGSGGSSTTHTPSGGSTTTTITSSSTSTNAGGDAGLDGDACVSITCAEQGFNCGTADDGCGHVLDCGTCPVGLMCGFGCDGHQCGFDCPGPTPCADRGFDCGIASDCCGGTLDCGTCTVPETCGGGGMPNVCGIPDGGVDACTPKTCAELGAGCGPVSDGCGNTIDCGTCHGCADGGDVCGLDMPNTCGCATCIPKTCAQQSYTCGTTTDGCGTVINCGVCPAGKTCGGGGTPNVCGP